MNNNIDELLGITTPATPATPAAASTPQASDRLDALLDIAPTTAPAAVTSPQVTIQQSTPAPALPAPMDDLLGIPLASAPATPAGPSFMRRRRDQVARWIQGARDPARRAALLVAINPLHHASGRRITLRIAVVVVAILGLRTVVWHIERAIQHPPVAAQTTKPTPKPAPPRTVSAGVKATAPAPTSAPAVAPAAPVAQPVPVIPAPTSAPAVAPAAPVAQPAPVIPVPTPTPAVAPTRAVSAAVKPTSAPVIPAQAPTVQPPVVRQPAPHAGQPASSAAAKAAAAAAERALNSFFQPTQPKKTGGRP